MTLPESMRRSPSSRPTARRGGIFTRTVLAAAGAATALALLAGCSTPSGPAPSDPPPSGSAASQVPPIIADLTSIDNTTVTVPAGNSIDLTGDDTTFTKWDAKISDTSIASFVPGRDDGSAQFNPGIDALKAGETNVVLTNSESGKTVTFTVEVPGSSTGKK